MSSYRSCSRERCRSVRRKRNVLLPTMIAEDEVGMLLVLDFSIDCVTIIVFQYSSGDMLLLSCCGRSRVYRNKIANSSKVAYIVAACF